MNTISVIICAYNEEETISSVIETILKCPYIDQVIAVNDGSTDSTEHIIRNLAESTDLSHINLVSNMGKGYSMAAGIESSIGEIILFLDADIVNLKYHHINNLVQPILDGNADMVMGQPGQTFINTRYNPFKALTGQRAVIREHILPIINDIRFIRFGVETYINLYYQSEYLNIKRIILEDLVHYTKFRKMKKRQAIFEFLKEGKEILATIINNTDLVRKYIKRQINPKRLILE